MPTGAGAILNALDCPAGGSASQAATTGKDLAIAEGQLRDDQARLGQPFSHDLHMAELTRLRDQLRAGLSGATPERVTEPVPVTELAERIKARKAAHTLEPAPSGAEGPHVRDGGGAGDRPHPPAPRRAALSPARGRH